MIMQEYRQIRAEIAALERMLLRLPASRIIDRMSLKARKRSFEVERH
jgi:hypothetical protein